MIRNFNKVIKKNIVTTVIYLGICGMILIHYSIINQTPVVSYYILETSLESKIRVVHLTDLHNQEFGKKNKKLIKIVKEHNPDLIVMTGDMINRDEQDLKIIKDLISKLTKIAPVYYGYGNHETTWEEKWGLDLHDELSEVGATVLECEYKDIEIKKQNIRIGGYMGYYGFPHMMTENLEKQRGDFDFFSDFRATSNYRILLNHIPTQWVDWGHIDDFDMDLIFSGHYHGGQLVLPLIGPLYAPYVGWFPENTKGVFEGENATCVLSAGLGTEYSLPRINNPPEVVVVDLIPE